MTKTSKPIEFKCCMVSIFFRASVLGSAQDYSADFLPSYCGFLQNVCVGFRTDFSADVFTIILWLSSTRPRWALQIFRWFFCCLVVAFFRASMLGSGHILPLTFLSSWSGFLQSVCVWLRTDFSAGVSAIFLWFSSELLCWAPHRYYRWRFCQLDVAFFRASVFGSAQIFPLAFLPSCCNFL